MIDFTKCKATLVPKNEDLSSGLELYVRAKDVLDQLENLEKEKENLKTVFKNSIDLENQEKNG